MQCNAVVSASCDRLASFQTHDGYEHDINGLHPSSTCSIEHVLHSNHNSDFAHRNQTPSRTMFDRSWFPPALREFIDERVLKRTPLRRLAPGGSKNLRDSWPTKAERQRLDALAAENEKQASEAAYEKKWKGKPIPIPPPHEASANKLPAITQLAAIVSPNTRSEAASQNAQRPSVAALHLGNQNRNSRIETLDTITSFFADNDDENDFKPDLHVPVRASELTNSTDWPGHALLLCNPAFLTRLTDLLKARKAYERAKRDANLIRTSTDAFALKLKLEIARTEIRLKRLDPDIRLAKQYNVFENATGGPSATALKLEKKVKTLEGFRQRATERCADTFAALEQRSQMLRAAQAAVNADLEKAFSDAGMLGDDIGAPDVAQASDVIGEYRALCLQNGIKWDDREGEKLPESLRVGPAVEEIDGKDIFELA